MRSRGLILHPDLRPFTATVMVPGKPETECTYLLLAASLDEAEEIVELTKDPHEEMVRVGVVEVGLTR